MFEIYHKDVYDRCIRLYKHISGSAPVYLPTSSFAISDLCQLD